MEKRTSITRLAMAAAIAALVSSATAYAGVAVPYSSDLGVNYSLASDWTQQYDRNSKPWEYDRASDFSPQAAWCTPLSRKTKPTRHSCRLP